MAATPGTIATAQTGSNSRLLSWNHTVAADDTLLILAMAANGDNSDNRDISSLTVNGAPATFIPGSQFFSSGGGVARWIEGWYFDVTALNGTAAISVVYNSAGSTATIVGHSMTFKGTDPVTPLGAAAGASGSSSPISATVASASGGLVFSALSQRTGVATGFPSGSLVTQTDSQTSGGVYASLAVQPGAASVTASYTTPSANHGMFAVPINAATGGGGGTVAASGVAALTGTGTLSLNGVGSGGSGGGGSTGAVPTQVGTTTIAEASTGFTVVGTAPSGLAVGDFMVAFMAQKGSGTVTAPDGWTLTPIGTATPGQVTSSTAGLIVMHKYATSADIGASWTFTAGVTDGVTIEITAWRGVDSATAFDAAPVTATAGSSTSVTVGPITSVTANDLLLYACVAQTTGSAMTADPALTTIGDTTGSGRRLVVAFEPNPTAGASTARTYTTTSNLQKAAVLLALRPAAAVIPVGPAPTLTAAVVGISDPTVGHVKIETSGAVSARLRATPVGGGTAILGTAVTPDANNKADLAVAGLTPGVWYTWEVGAKNSSGTETFLSGGTLRAAPQGATNFSFDFGSCTDATDSASLAAIAARSSDLFLHVGDLYYADGSGTTVANIRTKMAAKVTVANHKAVFTSRSSVYTPSDHDGMNNNSDAGDDPTAWTNWNQVVREYFPADKFPATTGVYYTFVWGRVRFIVWDDRSFKSDKDNTDNAAKTALGAAQKQWSKDVITAATEPVIVVVQSSPWIDTSTASEDGWGGYITERNEMGDFIAASGKNVVMLGGDMHAVAADDGTSANARGIKMMLQAAPFNNSASQKGGPYKVGPYPTGTGTVQQYGHVDITDTGSAITVAFQGLSSDNTQRVALSKTFTSALSFSGAVSLSGTGNLTLGGTPGSGSGVALGGSGSLSMGGTPAPVQSISLTGVGTLTTTAAAPAATRAVALTGVGSLTLAPTPRQSATLSLSGTGSLSLTGKPAAAGPLALTGVGALALAGVASSSASGSISLAGAGTLATTAGAPATAGAVALTGSGSLVLAGNPRAVTGLALTGGGSLTLAGTPRPLAALALSGVGTLALAGSPAATGVLALAGTGSLLLQGVGLGAGAFNAAGLGTLTITAGPGFAAGLSLAGVGSLVVAGRVGVAAGLPLSGVATLTLSTAVLLGSPLYLTGVGALGLAQVAAAARGAVTLSGTGSLVLASSPRATTGLALAGSGWLVLSGTPATSTSLTLTGLGLLTLASRAGSRGSVTLAGSGSLLLAGLASAAADLGLTGVGTLTLTQRLGVAGTLALVGLGVLSLASKARGSGVLLLTGHGELVVEVTGGYRSIRVTAGEPVARWRAGEPMIGTGASIA